MSIAKATTRCLQTMNACLGVEKLMKAAWAENRLADFNLWITGIGALASSRLSLDTRLNLKPEAREVITNLLNLLAITVDECQKIARETTGSSLEVDDGEDLSELLDALSSSEVPARPFSPWLDDDSTSDEQSLEEFEQSLSISNPLHKSMQDIEMLLDQLAQIAIAVRRSGTHSRLQRADQQFNPEEHADLQTHLTTIMLLKKEKEYSELDITTESFDSSNLSEIQKRLIRCNLKRRNRFLYAQRHSKSLGLAAAVASTSPPETTTLRTAQTSQKDVRTQSQQSSPSAPKAAAGEAETPTNPTITTGTKASADRKHIAYDLSPYTCILSGCANPDALYATKKDWRQHLLDKHQGFEYWICFSCEGAEQFRKEEEFIHHTKVEHESSISSDQISLLVDVCKRVALVEISSCPLCDWPKDEEGEVDKNVLLDHIAKELHTFSLRSLPWDDDNGQESEERIGYSSEKVSQWLISNELQKDPSIERPPLDEKAHASSYFRQNPYFAASSVSSNSSEHDSTTSIEKELKNLKEIEGSVTFGSIAGEALPEEDELSSIRDDSKSVTGEALLELNTEERERLQMIADLLGQNTEKEMTHLIEIFEKDVMALFLEQPKDQIILTKEVVKALARNGENGLEGMTLLLNGRDQITITEETVSSVAEEFDEETMALLLGQREDQTIITDDILEAAARNKLRSREMTAFLLERRGESDDPPPESLLPLRELDINTLASHHKKIGSDWTAVFNPHVKRVLDVDLVRSIDHKDAVFCVHISYDGKYVATGIGGLAQIFDINTGDKVCELVHNDREGFKDDNIIHSIGFSPDGRFLATAENEYVRVWDIATRTVRNQFSVDLGYVNSLDFARDGRTIVSDRGSNVHLWDIEQNGKKSTFHNQGSVKAVAISPDARSVAAGLLSGKICLWDVVTSSLITTLEGPDSHVGAVSTVCFLPNGKGLVSGSFDYTIKIWDLNLPVDGPNSGTEGNKCIRTLEGHSGQVQSVALTTDASFVLSGSQDGSVQFWDTRNGVAQLMLRRIRGGTIYSVASSPRGGYFATGSGDNMLRIWSYSPY
ncbi:hypothetical protein ACHAQJ_002559 [Trichoderma viride]